MFIPYILVPVVLTIIAYFATTIGLVPVATFIPPWVTPPIIGGFLATQSFRGALLAAFNLFISVAMYIPFVSIATRMQEENKR